MTRPKSHSVWEASRWRRLDESVAKADFAKYEEVKGESKSSPGRERTRSDSAVYRMLQEIVMAREILADGRALRREIIFLNIEDGWSRDIIVQQVVPYHSSIARLEQ